MSRLRKYGRVILAANGFFYDLGRYFKYAGWRVRIDDLEERNYYIVRIYHALEKSMSFSERRPGSGWVHANLLLEVLEKAADSGDHGCHDRMGITVLEKFLEVEQKHSPEKYKDAFNRIENVKRHYQLFSDSGNEPGVVNVTREEFKKGSLDVPESFFHTRRSLREYDSITVPDSVFKRAVKLAMATPSVCNRQEWHVYHLSGEAAQKALAEQNGNRGFGHKIKQVLIVTTDLKAFSPSNERYQHWIDGGMFSMSLIWALHSLGVASCCLNWSQSGKADIKLRKAVPIRPEHTVMMMISIGYPRKENKVCSSVRRPVEEVFTKLSDDVSIIN